MKPASPDAKKDLNIPLGQIDCDQSDLTWHTNTDQDTRSQCGPRRKGELTIRATSSQRIDLKAAEPIALPQNQLPPLPATPHPRTDPTLPLAQLWRGNEGALCRTCDITGLH